MPLEPMTPDELAHAKAHADACYRYGKYYTPRKLIEQIVDPACGSGAFLLPPDEPNLVGAK